MTRRLSRLAIVTLLVLACAGMLAQTGSVPHLHQAHEPGIYNEEHDLTLLAALAAQALLVDGTPVPAARTVVGAPPTVVVERPAIRCPHAADSRAPPTA